MAANATADWLQAEWQQLFAALAVDPTAAERAWLELAACYSHPDRHYHNLVHLRQILETINRLKHQAQNLPAVLLAAWFHDIVYEPRAQDNEERSAAYAQAVGERLGVPKSLSDRAAELILLTKTHTVSPDDRDGQILLDADLAILGAPPEVYRRYAAAIRQEYAWVPEEDYRQGRAAVLQRFERRPVLFHSSLLRDECELQARQNLQAERVVLTS